MTRTALALTASRRLLVTALLALGFVTATALPSQAWTYAGYSGRPGGASIPAANVLDLYSGYTPLLTIAANGPTVSRSPLTTGAQDVLGVMVVQKWNGSAWFTASTRYQSVRIPAGYSSARFSGFATQPTTGSGYYRVRWGFTWHPAGSSTVLGASVISPDRVSDHACITRIRPCLSYAGYVRVGRLLAVGGGW